MEVLSDSAKLLAPEPFTTGRKLVLLFVLELQIISKIIHVDFEIVDDQSCGGNVCHEIVDIPAWHVVVPIDVSPTQ